MALLKRLRGKSKSTNSSDGSGQLGVQDLKSLMVPLMAQGDRGNDLEVAMALVATVACDACGAKVTAKDAWLPNENRMACPRCKKDWFSYRYGK